MEIIGKFQDNIIIILISFVVYFILYPYVFDKYFTFYTGLFALLIGLLLYVGYGSSKYEQKYKSPKVIGNNINHSMLRAKLFDISHIMDNHYLIFLGGYQDIVGTERLGREGVLLIDKDYLWVYKNWSVAISPKIEFKEVFIDVNSKYSEIGTIISESVGSVKTIFKAIPHNFQGTFSDELQSYDIDSTNINTYLNRFLNQISKYRAMLNGEFEQYRKEVTTISDINKERRGFFKRKEKIPEGES